MQAGEALAKRGEIRVKCCPRARKRGQRHRIVRFLEFAFAQTQTLEFGIDMPDITAFDLLDLRFQAVAAREARRQFIPGGRRRKHHLAFAHSVEVAIKISPLGTLGNQHICRILDALHLGFRDPAEIAATDISVADLHEIATHDRHALGHPLACLAHARRRDHFVIDDFAQQTLGPAVRRLQHDRRYFARPEMREPVGRNQNQDAEHHHET